MLFNLKLDIFNLKLSQILQFTWAHLLKTHNLQKTALMPSSHLSTSLPSALTCHIQRASPSRRNARRGRIRYLQVITLDKTKYMWDGPENAEQWRLQREQFAEEAA